MTSELLVDFAGMQVLPEQDLEGKMGYFATIRHFHTDSSQQGGSRVEVESTRNTAWLDLSSEDFRKLYDFSGIVGRIKSLSGKKVISVYKGDELSGLIPLNSDK